MSLSFPEIIGIVAVVSLSFIGALKLQKREPPEDLPPLPSGSLLGQTVRPETQSHQLPSGRELSRSSGLRADQGSRS